MDSEKKRRPISAQVQQLVLTIAVGALLLSGLIAVFSMQRIKHLSEEALLTRMEHTLSERVQSKALLADSELGKYAGYIEAFAEYLHQLYVAPEEYVAHPVSPPDKNNGGVYTLQRALASESLSLGRVKTEIDLLGNAEQIFHPVMIEERGLITSIYLETESGVMIAYDQNADISAAEDNGEVYADFRDSGWYRLAMEKEKPCFTDVYEDSFGRGLTISCAAPFYDASGKAAGVVAMDILIADLYDRVVELDLGENAYAFLVDSKGNAIAPEAAISSIQDDPDMDQTVRSEILNRRTGVEMAQTGTYYAFTPITSVDWMLCIHVPQELILAPVKTMDSIVLTLILVFLAVVLVILLLVLSAARKFSAKLTEPLIELGKDVGVISGGNLDYRAVVRNNDEIGDLAIRFNEMADSLKKYIKHLTTVTAKNERITAELTLATRIQADMLPHIFPAFPERSDLDLFASMTPAKEVGGDFYDFFFIDDDHLCLVIADVSGKGVPAALFMMVSKIVLQSSAMLGISPAEILKKTNDSLCANNQEEMFVTVWVGILEMSTGKLTASNAGHEYPVIRHADGKFELFKDKHGFVIGGMEGVRYKNYSVQLEPGAKLFVYTDGVPEATDADNQLFGTDRLVEALNQDPEASPEKLLKNLRRAVDDFVKDAEQFDDLTMLCVEYKGKDEPEDEN